jgi:sugar-specific transcriptional regulator TrmB
MSNVKEYYEALRDECERMAREAERQMASLDLSESERANASDRARVYWQMRAGAADTIANASDAKLAMIKKPKGETQMTKDRRIFLQGIAVEIDTDNREAVAATALQSHGYMIKKLWSATGEKARGKILNFMKNQGLK